MKNASTEGMLSNSFTPDYFYNASTVIILLVYTFQAGNQKEVTGVIAFSGSVCSYAYLNSKEPISQAVAQIKVFQFHPILYLLEWLS